MWLDHLMTVCRIPWMLNFVLGDKLWDCLVQAVTWFSLEIAFLNLTEDIQLQDDVLHTIDINLRP